MTNREKHKRDLLVQVFFAEFRLGGFRPLLSSVLVIFLLHSCLVGCSAEQLEKKRKNQSVASATSSLARATVPMIDGKNFMVKCLQAAESYKDYSFDYVQTVYKGKATVVEKGSVLVKKPAMKVIVKSGPKAGSVAVLLPDGQVKAHGGGAFKFISVVLPATSDLLRSANGWPMVKSDFGSIWQAMKGYAENDACQVLVTDQSTSVPSQTSKVLVLEMTKPSGELYKRVLIDPKTNLPLEWWDYQSGKMSAHSLWTNFKGNQGLSDKVFSTTKIERGAG